MESGSLIGFDRIGNGSGVEAKMLRKRKSIIPVRSVSSARNGWARVSSALARCLAKRLGKPGGDGGEWLKALGPRPSACKANRPVGG